ncbi:MAG TPA: creatininase family protein [Candidatus Nitrosotalea sp.]|nr:creatininase family protein [Nitrososphaerota archaeon]HKU32961.1 creatininase family protein [Candidatus Nitrosotalea sp.]
MIARDLSHPHISKEIKKNPVAIIPVGSIEQHGPHLPISTDSDIISYIADKVAQKTGFLLLPTIQCGVSFEHHPFFNLSVDHDILQKYITAMCLSLAQNKVRAAIILNGHHGNQKALKDASRQLAKSKPGFRVLVYSYWHFMEHRFDHAGFVETSIMRVISKRVEMSKAVKGFDEKLYTQKELDKIGKIANKSFISVTKNGVWGDPRSANAKEGRKILSQVINSIVKESQTCLTGKSRKLHQ